MEEHMKFCKDLSVLSKLSYCEQLLSLPEQIDLAMEEEIGEIPRAEKVCIFGIGESSVAGDIISAYADNHSEIIVPSINSDIVPGWVDEHTDVILVSYFGMNSLINSVYEKVKERGCRIYCIAHEGRISEKCKKDGNALFKLPNGFTSRSILGYELALLSTIIERMGICDARSKLEEISSRVKEYRNSIFTDKRIDDLRFKLYDNVIAIYGSPDFRASFKRWKMSLNEDIGVPSFCGELPEFNHNEIVGWANHNQDDDDLRIVMLRGEYKNRILSEITDKTIEVLEENGRHVIDLKILGGDTLEKNLRAIILADYISQTMKYEGKDFNDMEGSE